MKIEKLQLSKRKVDINLQFYFFLKHTSKLQPSDLEIMKVIEECNLLSHNVDLCIKGIREVFKKSKKKLEQLDDIVTRFKDSNDIDLFLFSIKLHQIKNLLLQEAKITESTDIEKLSNIDPLSLEYDRISVIKPYNTRVSGALLSLLFFDKLENKDINFMSENTFDFIKTLSDFAIKFKKKGLEPNQIFMLMFSESMDQSIKSDSGSNYESRIKSVLSKNGIKDVKKAHDKNDKSTEFDCLFGIEGRTFGIGAKRTLRERYKQFIKTAITSKIDVMIEITLGLDLNEEKAKTIVNHGTYIFVADEIYKSREYLQKLNKVYSVKNLNYEVLRKLK
ncbi:MAG: hypothetical protein JJW01_00940 [Alphaproteobacteria bacterium]|nr:hypothetical protein [Rickettsiales bacterium]